MFSYTLILIVHIFGILLLVVSLFLDGVSVYRWNSWRKRQDDTPGYGSFPLPLYIISSLLIWNDWRFRFRAVLFLVSFHVGYQLILLAVRLWTEKKKIDATDSLTEGPEQ